MNDMLGDFAEFEDDDEEAPAESGDELQGLEEEIEQVLRDAQSCILGTLCAISHTHPMRAAYLGERLSKAFAGMLRVLERQSSIP